MTSKYDVVATITMTLADGRTVVRHEVLREDVTGANNALWAVQDSARVEINDALKAILMAHRDGQDIGSAYYLTHAS